MKSGSDQKSVAIFVINKPENLYTFGILLDFLIQANSATLRDESFIEDPISNISQISSSDRGCSDLAKTRGKNWLYFSVSFLKKVSGWWTPSSCSGKDGFFSRETKLYLLA